MTFITHLFRRSAASAVVLIAAISLFASPTRADETTTTTLAATTTAAPATTSVPTTSSTTTTVSTSTSVSTTVAGPASTSSSSTPSSSSEPSSTTTMSAPSSSTTSPPSPQACPTDVCGWAVVADDGTVHGVIVCNNWCAGRTLPGYMGCVTGCRLVVQGQQTADGNVAGWHGPDVKYNDEEQRFSLPGGGSISAGARMEEAVFPTTTVAEVSTTVVDPVESDGSPVAGSTPVAMTTMSTTASAVEPVADGESVVIVDGDPVTTETVQSAEGTQVLAGDVTATMSRVDARGDDDAAFNPGDAVTVDVIGLQPNSTVEITIHSEPRNLGRMTVDASGRLVALVQIPVDMPAGNHTVVVRGRDVRGDEIELRFGVTVARGAGIAWSTWSFIFVVLGSTFLVLRRRSLVRALSIR